MSEYTPTPDDVRAYYVRHIKTTEEVRAYYVWSLSRAVSRERGIEFDRWLAAHDAEVADR